MKNLQDRHFVAHPWHGISAGEACPKTVNVFVEIVPTDVMKYEVDKQSGHMKLDRPQRYSSQCPCLYGFIPQTYCDGEVTSIYTRETGKKDVHGDGDPLDILVLAERPIQHSGILVEAAPIGGLRLIDKGEVDDKIIAVLSGDAHYHGLSSIEELPRGILDRIRHYFLTYKSIPSEGAAVIEIAGTYSRDAAFEVIAASQKDYTAHMADLLK